MQPDLIGGRYRVESAIGQGGMGTVWLCRDETLHRVVAVKQVGLLPGESVTDSARAFREARSSAGLSHRNVVTIFDVVEDSGHIWLVMEYVAGRSLAQMIKQDGPLAPATVAEIGAHVADGLAALHAAGTTHRDVKPGNVLVREDGVAKISDFGIARTTGDPSLTMAGLVTGTPSYFSPSLARGDESGPADDVWALGVTLYTAVEGRLPYEQHANPMAVLHEIASTQPLRPSRAEFLEPALKRMLDRESSSRWSMEDAAHMLRQLADSHHLDATMQRTLAAAGPELGGLAPGPAAAFSSRSVSPPSAAAPSTPPSPARLIPTPQRRSRKPAYLVLGLVALLLAAVAVALNQLGTPQQPSPAAGRKPSSSSDTTTKAPSSGSKSGSRSDTATGTRSGAGSAPGSGPGTASGSGSGTGSGSGAAGTADLGSTPGARAKEQFVRDYYAKAPGGSDAAWAMLGPGEQAQGRGSFDGFWRTISSVEVQSAQARPGSNQVAVTLLYRSVSGKTSTEHKLEGLVPDGNGGLLLESDVPAG